MLFLELGLAVFLYLLPGWALLRIIGPSAGLSWKVKAGLAPALSVSLYPLLYLAARLVHIPVTGAVLAFPGFMSAAGLIWINRGFFATRVDRRAKIRTAFGKKPALDSVYFLVILAAIFLSRMIAVGDLAAPCWGDSVHHTMIVRLLVENRGLFTSWTPYAPMLTFTYHFGFHSAVAAWAQLAGVPATSAVLTVGQILNGLAVLALYPIGVKLGRSVWAGLGAIVTAGLLSVMPGFSVDWGRYTQLTSLVILPVLVWFLEEFWRKDRRPKAGTAALLSLLIAGNFMAHYRVTVIALTAIAAWSLWAVWDFRKHFVEWLARAWRLGVSGAGALVLVGLWIPDLLGGWTPRRISIAMRTNAAPRLADTWLWSNLGVYIGPIFWIVGIIVLAVAFWRNRKLAFLLVLWIGLAFLTANPYLIGLPGTGIVSNFVLVAGLYIPIAWLAGSAAGEAGEFLHRKPAGRLAVAAVLAVCLLAGFGRQSRMVNPFYRMVEPNDVAAFRWIRLNTPRKARFMVNATLAFNNSAAVGSDAGWWMPYYTRRWIPVLPLQFSAELMPPGFEARPALQLVLDLQATGGNPERLARIFLREKLDYVFIGERRGRAAHEAVELLPEKWFIVNPYFVEEARFGAAMIWRFDPKAAASIPD